ncbi:uncharacterized protein LOC123012040 [Tribolium madens]|uniref:uncharacterized protein LOC123012040 n=1 Tax=Tribolium madens TaxID=41895 RepID=UPI001CF76176|nr:uncharacterized protein LOC123012040 [Tribolium madens]
MKNTSLNFAITLYFFLTLASGEQLEHKNETKKEQTPSTCKENVAPRSLDSYAFIRNPRSGLVLQANEVNVIVVYATGTPNQMWVPEYVGSGKFNIINQGNGRVLDIGGNCSAGSNVITEPKEEGDPFQEWHLHYGEGIINAKLGFSLNIPVKSPDLTSYKHGMEVKAHPWHGGDWQHFILQRV